MRMQAWRLAQVLPQGAPDQVERYLREFDASVALLRAGDPARPLFDLVLMGAGPDGHTASLFPDTPAVTDTIRWVVPGYAPQGTRSRITITLGVINHASVVLFLITGRNKAVVVQRILERSADEPSPYPAALVRPEHGRLLWYLDRAAASELTIAPQHLTSREDP